MNLLIKLKAVLFCTKMNNNLSVDTLIKYFKKHNYKVTRFNKDSERTKTLFSCLKIKSCFLESPAFTYKTKEEKIVFLAAGLSDREVLHALIREAAHIELNHAALGCIAGNSIKMLSEAAEFTERVTNSKGVGLPGKIIIASVITVAILSVSFIGYISLKNETAEPKTTAPANHITEPVQSEQNEVIEEAEEYVYVTKYGECYHRENCRYAKTGYKVILTSVVLTEYRPCSVCIPQ